MKDKTKKSIILIVRFAATLIMLCICGYLIHRYEYFIAISSVDNLIGAVPIALLFMALLASVILLWMKHTRKMAVVSIFLAIVVVLSVALFPNSLRGNWWIGKGQSSRPASDIDITVFEPFSENSQLAKLNEPSKLKFSDPNNLPILDGATAFYPMYAAFTEAVYAKDLYSKDIVRCTKTNKAYDSIIAKEVDVIFALAPSKEQLSDAKSKGANLHLTTIGKEAFVFVVGDENPIDNLSEQQIRNIYSGKTARWSTIGWNSGGNIIAFQRPEGSGSQTGLQSVMGELPIQAPQPLPDESLIGTNSLMQQVSVEWQGVQPALGYSYKYFATVMNSNPHAKILSVNNILPTQKNIENESYPFVFDFYAITNGKPTGNTKKFIEWILSPQGQYLVEQSGYTPINN